MTLRPFTGLLDRFFDGWTEPMMYDSECEWLPPSDIRETDTAYLITMELPGIDMKNLDLSFADGMLMVKGEKSREVDIGESCSCEERYFGSFERSFRIEGRVDPDHIDAGYKDGILKISLPKTGESVVKKIEVH